MVGCVLYMLKERAYGWWQTQNRIIEGNALEMQWEECRRYFMRSNFQFLSTVRRQKEKEFCGLKQAPHMHKIHLLYMLLLHVLLYVVGLGA